MDEAVNALLSHWGIAPVDDSDRVVAQLSAECARIGIPKVDITVRWARATIRASVTDSARLRWHADQLTLVAKSASHGTVDEVRISPSRPSGSITSVH